MVSLLVRIGKGPEEILLVGRGKLHVPTLFSLEFTGLFGIEMILPAVAAHDLLVFRDGDLFGNRLPSLHLHDFDGSWLGSLFGRDNHIESPRETLHIFLDSVRYVNLADEIAKILFCLFPIGLLPPSEHHLDLDLVSLGKEFFDLIAFEEYVVFIGAQTYPDTLDIDFVLLAFRLLLLLGLLVLEFPIVYEPADGRLCVGGNLYQIEFPQASRFYGCFRIHFA